VQEFLDTWSDFHIGPYPHDAHLYWLIAEAIMKEVPGAISKTFCWGCRCQLGSNFVAKLACFITALFFVG
jgi:hypothetical protein